MKLRLCPFCGSRAAAVDDGDGKRWYVACLNLGCYAAMGERYDRDAMPDHHFTTQIDAEKAWNRRAR